MFEPAALDDPADPWLLPGAARTPAPGALPVGALVVELIAVPARPTVLLHARFDPGAGLDRILMRGCSVRGLSVLVETARAAAALAVAWPDPGASVAGVALGWDGARLTLWAAPGGVQNIRAACDRATLPLWPGPAASAVLTGAAPGLWTHPATGWHAVLAAPFRPFPAALVAAATAIDTPTGPRRAGDLRPGDAVITLDRGPQRLCAVVPRRLPARGRLAPVRLRAGYCPAARDVVVGPRQAVLADGWGVEDATGREEILIRAADMLGTRLAMPVDAPGTVPMVSLGVDAPALLMAEGHAIAAAGPLPLPVASPTEAAAILWRYRHRAVTV